uniref:RagB/SusD family nutrient uptake outer membrane protein n=1 Tax=Alloprevotella sp. TaxID=1872471 RepID=UPI003FEDD61B
MKSKIFLGCMLAAGLFSASCSDFLTEDPKGQLDPKTYYNSADAVNSAVYALYTQVNVSQIYTNMLYPQWQGDDITANPASNKQAVAEIDGFSASNNNKGVREAWEKNYKIIEAANNIINNIKYDENTVYANTAKEAVGQAHFWRAFAYYYLVRLYGPLPIIERNSTEYNEKAPATIAEVYDYIVKEMKAAIEVLPTSYTGEPAHHNEIDAYVTKQAAQSALTAVYMSMAGYPLNKTEYYGEAAKLAKEVIDNNSQYGFYLDNDWSHVYSMGHNYNKETILGIDYSPLPWWTNDSEFTSCDRFESLGDKAWGDAWGEIAFWKRFPEGKRKKATYAEKITFQDPDSYTIVNMVDWWALNPDGTKVVPEYHPMFCNFTVNADAQGNAIAAPYDYTKPNWTGMVNDHRHRVIRYSELLLWYAESAARSGAADLSFAKDCLKKVRERACDDPYNVTLGDGSVVNIDAMTAEQLAEACYIEHGWEVAGYWVAMVTRRSDEFRMDELKKNFDFRVANADQNIVDPADGRVYKAKESVDVVKSTWQGAESIYLPYPVLEVEKNPNLRNVDRTK